MGGTLGEFLSPEAGQRRRQWLTNQEEKASEALKYYLGPAAKPVDAMAKIVAALSDPADVVDYVNASKRLPQSQNWQEAVSNTGQLATAGAAMLMPGVSARMAEGAVDFAGDAARFMRDQSGAVKFRRDMRGYHHGQSDETLRIFEDDTPVGGIDYSVYDGDPSIQMIEVAPEFRRRGYASEGLREMQRTFPDREIDWGMMTPEGAALYDATAFTDIDQTGGVSRLLPEIEARYRKAEAEYLETFKDGFVGDAGPIREVFYRADEELELAQDMAARPPMRIIKTDPISQRGDDILQRLRTDPASVTDEMLDMGDTTQNARLNEYLFNKYDLPMDEASRMARAEGWRDAAHGAGEDITAVDNDRLIGGQFWSTDDLEAISDREVGAAGHGVTVPLKLDVKNPGGWTEYDKFGVDELRGRGYDGLALKDDASLMNPGTRTTYVTYDPQQVRSRFARFDPRLAHLRNLSAGLAGGAALPLGAYLNTQPDLER